MKQNRLGFAIVIGMLAGVSVGYLCHQYAAPKSIEAIANYLSLLTEVFLRLIKMVIAPLVLTGLVTGLASLDDARSVGRIGLKALGWFFCASVISLTIGLVLANLFDLGHTMHLPMPTDTTGVTNATFNLRNFIAHIVPSSVFQSLASNEILPIVLFAVFFGIAAGVMKDRLPPALLASIDGLFTIMLKVTSYVMWFAPLGVFGAIAAVIAVHGLGMLATYGKFIGAVYFGMVLLWALLLAAGYSVLGKSVLSLVWLIRQPMAIAFWTASAEAAYPQTITQLTRFGIKRSVSNFVLPLAYSFNLDGSMMYQAFAALFVAQVYNIHLSLGQQFIMLMVMLLTSKGIAGVPRASIVVISASLPLFGLPAEGVLLLLAIDQFVDMGRTATNVVGNSIATAVVARWENALAPWNGHEHSLDEELSAIAQDSGPIRQPG
ncbi:dicarboxylate/amino acid:cation symporter [Burkholderia diffusa]|uniref:dicarboxylate/amino acid:cation symporter n=1 Tax=Burkholderia diffusa TaxID=488732 RepID=UPI00157A289F|nr:dicarboxylate/amino acid:cation symporter [Burkholderia diffusa]NTY41505.1 dicarboxylate/amino acid:cation symporter [Burkholderia diffusa]